MLSFIKRQAKRFPWLAHRYRQWRDAAFERVEPQVTPFGFRLSGQRDMMNGTFEPAETMMIRKLVGSVDVFVDVGANIGFYALMLNSYLNGQGAIICLEPDPTNLIELLANVAANRLEQQISILPMAAGSEDGTVSFEPGLNAHAAENGTMQVAVRKLDSLNLTQVDFIKMDVEGYEGAVLDGARSLIERCRPTLFLELHPQLLTTHSHGEIVQFLQRH